MTNEATLSRKLLAHARSRRAYSDEDARAHMQGRLEAYSRVMFWALVSLRAMETVLYRVYPAITPRFYSAIFATGIIGLAAMAICWRGLLVRRSLSLRALGIIDLCYTASAGLVFGVTAVLAYERHESTYTCLVYACFVVFMRALVLPSSGRWTALVSAMVFAPLVIASGVLAAFVDQEVPSSVYFACGCVFSIVPVVIATFGSKFVYGLRRRVNQEMQLGQYTLDRKIGEGGMGTVYSARHALLRRQTAIKLLNPARVGAETLDRFEHEVMQMSRLTHPNTVAVFDYGHNPDGVFYYAMEYLDGLDLEKLVATHGAQPVDRVVAILVQICGALHEAHTRGLVHRDIKPANIILCERGGQLDVAKVVDFGLAREISHDLSPHTIVGTPHYLAPEAITLPSSVGPAADLYALGAVAYFLMTGKRVFDGSPAELCHHHVHSPPPAPAITPALDELIIDCLAKNPTDRPTARALASHLRALAAGRDWDVDRARAWWTAFRSAPSEPWISSPTTMTIDLDARIGTKPGLSLTR